MSKKFNNKILLALLGGLVVIFFITNYLRNKTREANVLPSDYVSIDSAAVESISIFPKSMNGDEIKFTNQNGKWQVANKDLVSETNEGEVGRIIKELQDVKPQRLAAKDKEQWKKYQVTDSLATRVTINESGKGQTLNLYIGKFTYKKQQNPYAQYGGSQGITGTTYVRKSDDEKVYGVEGFLSMSFNQGFNSWRKSDFLKADKKAINRIQFAYPGNGSFMLAKQDSVWMVDNQQADPKAVDTYLNMFTNRPQRSFADNYKPNGSPNYTLTVSGNGMEDLTIQCWADTSGTYYMHSSLNPKVYFSSPAKGLFTQLFVGKDKFLSK